MENALKDAGLEDLLKDIENVNQDIKNMGE